MTQIGRNIKKIRNVKGISQQAFADLFELTRGNISSYEEFRADPKIEVVVRIANYFGIPLAEFIEKELSVNELLHYNTTLVLETEKLKLTQQLVKIPFVPALYITDYVKQYQDEEFLSTLPYIIVPGNSRFDLLALEIDDQQTFPAGFDYHNGSIVIYENVVKENAHRILGKLGMMVDAEGLKMGIYTEKDNQLMLALNEWISYPFDMETDVKYWVIKSVYMLVG